MAQDYDYRNYVIHNIKSLQRLDREGIFSFLLPCLFVAILFIPLACIHGNFFTINKFLEIFKKERDIAQKRYGDECYERLKETLAFGSRVPTTESKVSESDLTTSHRSVNAEKSPQFVPQGA